jgi:AcrR family transcriptional regulator
MAFAPCISIVHSIRYWSQMCALQCEFSSGRLSEKWPHRRFRSQYDKVPEKQFDNRSGKGCGSKLSESTPDVEQRILVLCADFIAQNGSGSLKIVELASNANVAVATIYYHFQSKTRLVARAQVHNYFALTKDLRSRANDAERAIEVQDYNAYWSAVSDSMSLAWLAGQPDDRWAIVHMLLDISSDAVTFSSFSEYLDQSIERWISIAERAKALGWVHHDVDTSLVIVALWSASIGQAIFGGSSKFDLSPERFKDHFLEILRAV